jgi:hypothetical protein
MTLLYIFLIIIVFFIVALSIWNAVQRRRGNTERLDAVNADPVDGTCCGQHTICEKDSLLSSFAEEAEYFDDEELDLYKGRSSEEYAETEANDFREVFYTMNDEDKPRWIRSLVRRGIEIPNQLKDEILLVVNDLRAAHLNNNG